MTSGVTEMTVRGATGPTASARAVGAGVAILAIWTAVTVLSIFAPSYVTGSDPTRIPTAAILSPIIGMVGTGFVAVFTTVFTASES